MKGDLDIDFAIGTTLFIFAFVAAFSYLNYEYSAHLSHETRESSRLKIAQIIEDIPKEQIEKRIVIAEGYSENGFVNLSDYRIDLILDEDGLPICFDKDLRGLAANISGTRTFSIYSAKSPTSRFLCQVVLNSTSDWIKVTVSSPIYIEAFTNAPLVNSTGSYCEKVPLIYFSGSGFEEKYLNVCV